MSQDSTGLPRWFSGIGFVLDISWHVRHCPGPSTGCVIGGTETGSDFVVSEESGVSGLNIAGWEIGSGRVSIAVASAVAAQ